MNIPEISYFFEIFGIFTLLCFLFISLFFKKLKALFFTKFQIKSEKELAYQYLLSASIKTHQCRDFLKLLSEMSNLDKTVISEFFWKLNLCTTMQDFCRGQVISEGKITTTPLECDDFVSNLSAEIFEFLEIKRIELEQRNQSISTTVELILKLNDCILLLDSVENLLNTSQDLVDIKNQSQLFKEQVNFSIETLKTNELSRATEIDGRQLIDQIQRFVSVDVPQAISKKNNI